MHDDDVVDDVFVAWMAVDVVYLLCAEFVVITGCGGLLRTRYIPQGDVCVVESSLPFPVAIQLLLECLITEIFIFSVIVIFADVQQRTTGDNEDECGTSKAQTTQVRAFSSAFSCAVFRSHFLFFLSFVVLFACVATQET
jgi:hypothetical protein